MKLAQLIEEVLKLPPNDQAAVVQAIHTANPEIEAAELTPEQQDDLDQRLDEYEHGETKFLTREQVIARLRLQAVQ